MKKLILIRHSESEANAVHSIGHVDVGLSDFGKISAQQFAQETAGYFDHTILISNIQSRCRALAQLLGQYNLIQNTIFHPGFNERDFGIFTGGTKNDMMEILDLAYPEISKNIGNNFSVWMDQNLYDIRGRLFESNAMLRTRLVMALDELIHTYPTQSIVIVSSTGILRTIQALLLSKTTQEFDQYLIQQTGQNKIPNLSMTEFVWNNNYKKFQLQRFNEPPIFLIQGLERL